MSDKTKKSVPRKLSKRRLILLIAGVLLLSIIGAVAGVTTSMLKGMPVWDPKALDMSASSTIYDKDKNPVTTIHGVENRVPIPYDKIPSHVIDAFLAIEDTKFWDHHGVSLRGITRALLRNVETGSTHGGSTITQQLAKGAFLSPEQTLKRKVQEAVIAIRIEKAFTKKEILELYLNRIYFGHGAYGLEMAAHTYFNKPASELTLAEGALLAAIPKSPTKYSPLNYPENALKRRNLVLENMSEYGFVTERIKIDNAKKEPLNVKETSAKNPIYKYPFFVDYVIEKVSEKYGNENVLKGGLKIYTTLDPKIQEAAEKAMANAKNYPASKKDTKGIVQPQGAIVILDPATGHIKALVGGREHAQQRGFNRATDAKRQPGSAFKPVIVYGPAIEKGKSPGYVVDDAPISYGSWKPRNVDRKFRGLTTLRKAITQSVNVVAVKLLKNISIDTGIKFAEKLGITTLDPKWDANLSIALGGLTEGVIPIELAGAYASYANKGVYIEPAVVTEVVDRSGNTLKDFKQKKRVVMKETTAWLMTDMMQSVVKSGTATRAQFGGWPIAGKTGTTSKGVDIWFAGYTPQLVGVVYIGYDDPKPMPDAYGGTYPTKIWREVMVTAHKGLKKTTFKKPSGIVSVSICTKSGDRPGPNCPPEDIHSEYFARGTVPKEKCDIHVKVEICAKSGQLATDYCPDTVFKSFIKPDASNASADNYPSKTCTIHGPGNYISMMVCTDPRHNGKTYLANLPNEGESGGCPEEYVKEENFPPNAVPKDKCPIPQHQAVVDKAPPKEEDEEQ